MRSATLAGASASWEYNAFAEPTRYSVEDPSGGEPLFEADYVRDSLGRITERTETVDGTTRTWRYSYDGRGRLADVERRDGGGSFQQVASYGWGPNNNRTSVSDGRVDLTSSQIEVDARDRLTRYGALTYDWDASGDLTVKTDTSSGDITRYDYDASGNLQDVELPDGRTVDYRIGPKNWRVGRVVRNSAGSVVDELSADLRSLRELRSAATVWCAEESPAASSPITSARCAWSSTRIPGTWSRSCATTRSAACWRTPTPGFSLWIRCG